MQETQVLGYQKKFKPTSLKISQYSALITGSHIR